jgi:hypothetical protein
MWLHGVTQEKESELRRTEEEQRVLHNNLQKSADDVSLQLAQVAGAKSQLEEQKQVLTIFFMFYIIIM